MKIWLLSDLHVDYLHNEQPFRLPDPRPDHDVVVIAGDLRHSMVQGVRWIANNSFRKPVIYIMGNHEPYGHNIDTQIPKAKKEAAPYPHIHILENEHVDIDGVRFIGAALWTDFCLMREDNQRWAMDAAQQGMNDYRFVRIAAQNYRRLHPLYVLDRHYESVHYITRMLTEPFSGLKVVVTHHAPSIRSIDPAMMNLLSAAYASHLDHLVDKATVWCHGHTHYNVDYHRGHGRVVTNQRGYNNGADNGFDPSFTIDIG